MEYRCSLLHPQEPLRFRALHNIFDVLVFYNDQLLDYQFLAVSDCLFSTFAAIFHILHPQFHVMPCAGDKGPTWSGILTFTAVILYDNF
jgi:hypothetical protein